MCSAGIEISLIPSTFSVNEERLQQKATSLSIPDFVKSTTVHLGCALAL